jgi:hypothetical protein
MKRAPQGLKAKEFGWSMSGLKPGPTRERLFCAACKVVLGHKPEFSAADPRANTGTTILAPIV